MREPAAIKGLYVVRLWDGMDGEWMDICEPMPYDEAKALWDEKTDHGKHRTSYNEIDYYRIFKAGTRMQFSEGRSMHR